MDLCVWDKCNNRCLMCTNPDPPWTAWDGSYDYGYEAIIKRLKKQEAVIKSDDSIYLSGGEPTLHPCFFDILEYLKKHFPGQRIKLLSNGRRFMYKDFTKKALVINDNFEIDLSIHGPTSHVHDSITRTQDSFSQAIRGLANLLSYKKSGQIIGIRYVITQLSYKFIGQFLKLIEKKFPQLDRLIFVFWEIEAQAIKNFKAVNVSFSQVRPYIEEIYPVLSSFKDIRFYHFPLCTLSDKFWPYLWRTLPENEVCFIPSCQKCNYGKYCLGIQKSYLKKIGSKEFRPIKKRVGIKLNKDDIYHPIQGNEGS